MANTPADLIEDVTEDGCRICRENKRDMLLEQYYMIHNKQCSSVITSKAANGYHFKTGQRDWPSETENVLPCRLLWWQVGFGTPASGAALEHVAVVQ
jgi:hypothetical protein